MSSNPDQSTPTLGQDGKPLTKSAEKKLAKKLEADAKKAAKQALNEQKKEGKPAPGTGTSSSKKPTKQVKVEPEWKDLTVPGQKKGKSSHSKEQKQKRERRLMMEGL